MQVLCIVRRFRRMGTTPGFTRISLWTTHFGASEGGRLGPMDDNQLKQPDQMRPIHTQRDLEDHWRALMGPLGFTRRQLWLGFLAVDRMMTPLLLQLEDLPEWPDDLGLDGLMMIAEQTLDEQLPGGRLAVLLCRPGPARMTAGDLAWARGLTSAARRNSIPMEPVHLANDERLQAFAPDDLAERHSA